VRVVLLGPPGAGKGTQATILATQLSAPHISTGDIFRANVSEGTPLGVQAKAYMDAGDLVPDDVTIAMVRDRLRQDDARVGFLLDGFPRNVAQAETLDAALADSDSPLDLVLELVVDVDEVVRRIAGRRVCQACGTVVSAEVANEFPSQCPVCGGELHQREDDKEATVRHRLAVYAEQTAPLVDFYRQRGLLVQVDAMGTVDEVTARTLDAVRSPRL
jgi:adenylate kinase